MDNRPNVDALWSPLCRTTLQAFWHFGILAFWRFVENAHTIQPNVNNTSLQQGKLWPDYHV